LAPFARLTSKISQFREDFLVLVLMLEVWAWLTTDPLPAHDRIEKYATSEGIIPRTRTTTKDEDDLVAAAPRCALWVRLLLTGRLDRIKVARSVLKVAARSSRN
jgi:hypothetical protein